MFKNFRDAVNGVTEIGKQQRKYQGIYNDTLFDNTEDVMDQTIKLYNWGNKLEPYYLGHKEAKNIGYDDIKTSNKMTGIVDPCGNEYNLHSSKYLKIIIIPSIHEKLNCKHDSYLETFINNSLGASKKHWNHRYLVKSDRTSKGILSSIHGDIFARDLGEKGILIKPYNSGKRIYVVSVDSLGLGSLLVDLGSEKSFEIYPGHTGHYLEVTWVPNDRNREIIGFSEVAAIKYNNKMYSKQHEKNKNTSTDTNISKKREEQHQSKTIPLITTALVFLIIGIVVVMKLNKKL